MIITSWNVNSIKARLDLVLDYLLKKKPDVLLLQEIKTESKSFPMDQITQIGYFAESYGQKSYNGVAIISKYEIKNIIYGLPNFKEDKQARYIEADINNLRIASLYLPNGNPINSDKFDYKITWMSKLYEHIINLLENEKNFILGGDWNIAPESIDVFDSSTMENDAVFNIESKIHFRKIQNLGLTDAFRCRNPNLINAYTYFDYQRRSWENKLGLRIDHLMLSPWIADKLKDANIETSERGKERPSDHVPIWCKLESLN